MLFNGRTLIFTFSRTQVRIAEIERLQSLFKMSMGLPEQVGQHLAAGLPEQVGQHLAAGLPEQVGQHLTAGLPEHVGQHRSGR